MKKTFLIVMMFLSILNSFGKVDKENKNATVDIEKLLSQMTLEEKVGQMSQICLDVVAVQKNNVVVEPLQLNDSALHIALQKWHVGSILNVTNNKAMDLKTWQKVIGRIQQVSTKETRLGIPCLYGIDAIHGTTYTAGATLFPQQIAMAATWNRNLVREGARITAYETRASNIPWVFSPVLDLGINPCWPRIWETFGEDTYLTSEMGREMIRGYEGDNIGDKYHVASCMKHFLGYSAAVSGKDRTPAYIPEYILRQVHLPAFAAAIEEGTHSVMINSGIINDIPVHANKHIITDILKNELQFHGLVVTDWADIENLYNRDKVVSSQKEAVKVAINAGIDMSMIPYDFDFCKYLVELVKEGEVPMSRIDDAVRRILKVKQELGLFEHPVTKLSDYPLFGGKEHQQKSYEAATECITLLKNNDKILPLSKDKKVLIVGPNANSMRTLDGGWSYSWQGEKVEEFAQQYQTILEAVTAKVGADHVNFVPGLEYNMEGKYDEEKNMNIESAVKASANADAILLCLGENSYTEKLGDLNDLRISDNQRELALALAKTGKPVVLILNEGRPRIITDLAQQMKAIIMTYLPGNEGGNAIADVLYGDVNPSGKLPYTYPMYTNSLVNYNHKLAESHEKMAGAYGYEGNVNVLYPFGYGLSYTSFDYFDLNIEKTDVNINDTVKVSVTVKNTGSCKGKEVVQVYYRDMIASLTPDNRKLCAFEKISLDPGESKNVSFSIPLSRFSFVNSENQRITEKGEFKIMVGNLNKSFTLNNSISF